MPLQESLGPILTGILKLKSLFSTETSFPGGYMLNSLHHIALAVRGLIEHSGKTSVAAMQPFFKAVKDLKDWEFMGEPLREIIAK
jgi:hypothetical protein